MSSFSGNLASLRKAMRENRIDACIIPSGDPHLGEYIPDHWRIIPWLTGFTGSAATVLVTDSFAGLWTDSRYITQARRQLADTGFEAVSSDGQTDENIISWLSANLSDKSILGFDGRILSVLRFRKFSSTLSHKSLTYFTSIDLITELWTTRPAMPMAEAYDFPVEYAGKGRNEKLAGVRKVMEEKNIDYHLLTSSEDIMWLLNIRGRDVKYVPLLSSFAIVTREQLLLFADENRIPFKLASEFDSLGIVILPYEETSGILSSLKEGSILFSPSTTSVTIFNSIPDSLERIEGYTIPGNMKAVRNMTEIENTGRAMVKDGVALTKFFFWLEKAVGNEKVTELSLAEKLQELRTMQEGYLGPSFQSIVAFREHASLPHYSPVSGSDYEIGGGGILLVDSGGQYYDGTTDITRTISIGRPSAGQVKDYTLVLKGHISLATAKIPADTRGIQLDILARRFLWDKGLNYGHGTGHGVGYCLNVHEGPLSISPVRGAASETIILPGMVCSNEPAVYREGDYGIRIENLILAYDDEETEFGRFMKFETISLCHLEKSLIDISMLDRHEKEWLNNYHEEVFVKLSPYLGEDERKWLREKTNSI